MNTENLINNISSGDAQSSNNTFNSVMADKMNAALDIRKQEVASSMYGMETPKEEEIATDGNV
jgi:hypothetical protein